MPMETRIFHCNHCGTEKKIIVRITEFNLQIHRVQKQIEDLLRYVGWSIEAYWAEHGIFTWHCYCSKCREFNLHGEDLRKPTRKEHKYNYWRTDVTK